MPNFSYKAIALDGQDVAGELEAANRSDLVRELALRGLSVTELAQTGTGAAALLAARTGGRMLRVRPKQLAALTRQLATSLEAGLPLITALEVMGQELDHVPSRELLKQLGTRVQEGLSLSDALAEHPRTFSVMYVRLVKVGETGGMLDSVMAQLADMMERQNELRDRVKTASIYPSIVLCVGILSVIIIVTVIVPRIVESIGAETSMLPWPTQVLMGMSDIFGRYWWLIGGSIVSVVLWWRQVVLRGAGRGRWDAVKLKVPILGRLVRQLDASRFARSLGMMVHGGVTITEAMAVARDTVANIVMRNAVGGIAEAIHSGESIARPLNACGLFPPLLVQMVRVGENTGRLGEMLLKAAEVHESEARLTLDRFVTVLPILMILVLACVVGFIVAGLVLAIVEFQASGFGTLGG